MKTFLIQGSKLPRCCSRRNAIYPGSVFGELLENDEMQMMQNKMMQNYKVWVNDTLLPTTLSLPQPTLAPFPETPQQPEHSSPSKSQPQRCTQEGKSEYCCCKHTQIKVTTK